MTNETWKARAGDTLGGFTVGHRAKRTGSEDTAYIVGVREEAGRIRVKLHFLKLQKVDAPDGATSFGFDLDSRSISCTWGAVASVRPHTVNALPTLHDFGSAPIVVPKGYSLTREVKGRPSKVQDQYKGQHVVLVKSAELHEQPGEFKIAVFEWTPSFEPWRHGGWYVLNVRYRKHGGACGTVSRNYTDKRWRIVDDPRRHDLNAPGDFTFASRDAAARAELELILQLEEEEGR